MSQMRVFVLETENLLSEHNRESIRAGWELAVEGTELLGSKILVLDGGLRLMELTGDGVPKLKITEDGQLEIQDGLEDLKSMPIEDLRKLRDRVNEIIYDHER